MKSGKLCLFGCGVLFPVILQMGVASAKAQENHHTAGSELIKTTVEFRVLSQTSSEIEGARIIVIGQNGKIVASGLTDKHGIWDASLSVEQDERFKRVQKMGTVTTLCVAKGYNEDITFEVPVTDGEIQPIILKALNPSGRNEVTRSLGNIHRHTIIDMLNDYASQYGLGKQGAVQGDPGRVPWSPEIGTGVQR